MSDFSDAYVNVAISRSSGADGAVVVSIETDLDVFGKDGGPGMRVELNGQDMSLNKSDLIIYLPLLRENDVVHRSSGRQEMDVSMEEIGYTQPDADFADCQTYDASIGQMALFGDLHRAE